jgi:hypothetical protein
MDILAELLTLSTQGKQARLLKLELEKRQVAPSFIGHFMTAIMPYLNCFWGKTTFTPKPVVISPNMHITLDGVNEFSTEAVQPLFDFVQSHTQYQLAKGQDITKLWLTHEKARKYFTMQFVPRLLGNKEGIYNMFHGFNYPVEAAKLLTFDMSEVQPLLDHVRLIWAQGDERVYNYILNWFAQVYQTPRQQTKVALVVRGSKGSGKGLMMEFMKQILGGQTYWHINKLSDITGNFQAPQRATCILGFADEAYFGGNACEANSLKTTITEESITVNIKNIPQFQIRSFINLVVCSNDRKMIPAGRGPRRFQCMETADTYAGAETDVTRAYYKRKTSTLGSSLPFWPSAICPASVRSASSRRKS